MHRLLKYKAVLLYLVFGVLTTLVNIAVYWLFYSILKIGNIPATIVAWVAAVLFAFVTNKLYVFESRSMDKKILLYELVSFYGCRFLTGVLDVAVMYLSVDRMHLNAILMKAVSNGIVIVLNYAASKLFIFKNGNKAEKG